MKTRLIVVTALLLVGAAPAAAAYCETNDWDCQRREAEQNAAYDASYEEYARKRQVEREQLSRALLKQPPLPAERNGLLGSWRLDNGPQGQAASILGWAIGWARGACEQIYPGGVTYSPDTYLMHAGDGRQARPITYRAGPPGGNPSIAVFPGNSVSNMRVYTFASPDRIEGDDACVLVRSSPPAANGPTGSGNARTTAASSSLPPTGSATTTAAAGPARKPIEPVSRLGRGVQLHGQKDFQQALQQLLVAAQSDPNDPRVYVYLADTYGWLGMDAEAKQAAERAKQLDPNAFDILR